MTLKPSSESSNKIVEMDRHLYNTMVDKVSEKKFKIRINPRMLVSERRNPIEKNYEVLEIIGKGGYGEVKKVKHKELDVIRALKIINKSAYQTPAELK
jgi:serine/threonine protein kinase